MGAGGGGGGTSSSQLYWFQFLFQKAMAHLIQGHELELAVAMGKVLGGVDEYTTVAVEMLSRRCEHLQKW